MSTGMLSESEHNARAADQGITVSAQVRELLTSAFQDRPDKAKEALLSHHGLQLRYFDDVRNEIGGVNVLDTLRKLLISDSTPIEEAIDTAITLTENGGETLQNDEGLSQIASDHAIRAFKDLDSYAISIIEDYVNNKLHHDARHSILEGLSDDILAGKISILAADKTAMEKLIWICFMRKLPKFSNKWSELCTFAADNSLLYCQMYQRLTQFTEFNDITPTSERYSRIVNPVDSRTGAEYDIVRYPINHTVLLKRGDRKPVESYIGKTITAEACAYIAQQMNDQVRGATRRSQPYRKYSPEEIMWGFKCIYYYKKSGNSWYDSHGYERIVITGKRKGGKVFDFLGEARKKGTFHEECERILLDRRSRSINNRRYAYEAIHKKLHEFGYSEDVCKTVLDNIVPILNNNRNNTYRIGMVKEWLDEAKK